jgi:hypothetical protein
MIFWIDFIGREYQSDDLDNTYYYNNEHINL